MQGIPGGAIVFSLAAESHFRRLLPGIGRIRMQGIPGAALILSLAPECQFRRLTPNEHFLPFNARNWHSGRSLGRNARGEKGFTPPPAGRWPQKKLGIPGCAPHPRSRRIISNS
jgi:hypothetical protein